MVDLTKRTETATASLVSLMKRAQADGVDLGEVSAACVLVMDHSGSMRKLYKNGHVQDIAERVLALSLTGLDDDGDIQVVFFDHKPFPAETVNAGNYAGFVGRWDQGRHYGTTNYADTIATVLGDVPSGGAPARGLSRFFKKTAISGPAAMPTLVFFVTDGAPDSGTKQRVKQLLVDAADKPVFWQFIGVNGFKPTFLEELDEMPGRVVDNVGLTAFDGESATDEAWFGEVLREFVTSWLPAARAAGIVASGD